MPLTPTSTTSSALHCLMIYLAERLSLAMPHGLIALLAALSGRTGRPVSVKLSGSDQVIDQIVDLLRDLLGERCRFISSATTSGLISLEGSAQVGTLIVDGVRDNKALETVMRIARQMPVARLDADNNCNERYRALNRPLSCILCRVDGVDEGGPSYDMIELHIADVQLSARSELVTNLQWLAGAEFYPESDHKSRTDELRSLLDRLTWAVRPEVPHIGRVLTEITNPAALSRFGQVMRLVLPLAIINDQHSSATGAVQIACEEIDFVLKYLQTAGAEDTRRSMTPGAVQFLKVVQRVNEGPSSAGAAGLTNMTRPKAVASSRLITCYDVSEESEFAASSIDAIRRWFKVLENAGMVEWAERIERRDAWKLTKAGLAYGESSLADLVAPHVQQLRELQLQDASA